MIRHIPAVRRTVEETAQGEAWVHRAVCPCGHAGPGRWTQREAEADARAHRDEARATPTDAGLVQPALF
ncbi:hypothetical protein [Marinactinospora rubrisoli]|uniref:Uncharacterized protein n=1 Tax=Marinactinospora rubrisoli TaxID=2715399 RepID=A0ABW2KPN2_9ACTN